MKLLPLSAIIIEPGKSKTYLRLLLVAYLFTTILIIYSSIYLFFKLALIGFLFVLLKADWINQSPCAPLKKIQFFANEWVLEGSDSKKESYIQANILITNILFQLIQFKKPGKKKLIILFHDQTTNSKLRLLHLIVGQK